LTPQGFTFVDHTADVAARLRGATLDDLFGAAAGALTAAITVPEGVTPRQSRAVTLEAADLELLLVDWVGELLYLFETDQFLVAETRPRVAEHDRRWRVEAEISGETRDPARHPIKVLVKAVTFHGLRIERRADGYETLVVFDI
jgi:SHS2 domain-containing protein